MNDLQKQINEIETRFKEVSGIKADLNIYPLKKQNNLQTNTRQNKSKKHGEVFTPLWLVDQMIETVDDHKFKKISNTLDLCAGYGQFTVRLIRKYYSVQKQNFDLNLFLEKHWINELQKSSAYKLIYIFGKKINLAMGNAQLLNQLPENARGIYYYSKKYKKWHNNNKIEKYNSLMLKKQFQRFDEIK